MTKRLRVNVCRPLATLACCVLLGGCLSNPEKPEEPKVKEQAKKDSKVEKKEEKKEEKKKEKAVDNPVAKSKEPQEKVDPKAECAKLVGAILACRKGPGLLASMCESTAKSQFDKCPIPVDKLKIPRV